MNHADHAILEPLAAAFRRLERSLPDFERRPGQVEMARLWEATLVLGGALAVEAPTGIGKSLAYLLPALLRRAEGAGPVLVSTHTKALQDQLLTRDVPLAARATGRPIRAAVLKGRASYLCRRRAASRLGQRRLFASAGIGPDQLDRLETWIETTETGSLDELAELSIPVTPGLLAEIGSDSLFCSGAGCEPGNGCFAKRARREARRADVIIVNHALLLADPGLRSALLPEAGALVIDEAHQLERVAREQLGVSLGAADLARLAGRTDTRAGALRLLSRAVRKGKGSRIPDEIARAEASLPPVLEHAAAHARDLERLLPHGVSSARVTRDIDLARVSPVALDRLLDALASLARSLERVLEAVAREDGRTLRPGVEDAADEVRARHAAWLEVEQALRSVTRLEERGAAFYLDRDERGSPRWNRRPLRVADVLRAQVFEPSERTLLTSATLAPEGDPGPLLDALGLDPDLVRTARLASPFPLERQVLSAVLDGPEPNRPEFVPGLGALVTEVAVATRRNVLVLLTSYQMLEQLASRIRPALAAAGVPLLTQLPGEAAAPLAREFRGAGGAVLLGTASFWEGVDFPGEALEVLVVARLPFPVPTDPLIEARSEQIAADGGDPFRDLMLPEAVLRFRQGVGRLIRTAEDRGAVVVVDPRIVRAGYGTRFLAALPTPPRVEVSPDRVASAVRDFLARDEETAEAAACPA